MTKFYSDTKTDQHAHLNNGDWTRIGESANSSSSFLIGKVIGQVDAWLARSSTSMSGTVYCRIRKGSDDSVAVDIGSRDVSNIPQTGTFPNSPITFGPNNDNTYAIVSGDKVTIEYSGGSSSNYLRVGCDGSDGIDGSKSCRVNYDGNYHTITSDDLSGNFWTAVSGSSTAPPPPPGSPPPPAAPGFAYSVNTGLDLAGFMWSISSGGPPGSPPGSPPSPPPSPPPPQNISKFYSIPSTRIHHSRFLDSSGSADSDPSYLRVGEIVNSNSSQLVGKVIKQIDFDFKKLGNPTGTLTVTIRKGVDDSIVAIMGTLDVSKIHGQDTYSTFSFVNQNNMYPLVKSDKIMAEYSGGNKTNYVGINANIDDPFDSKNSCTVYYTVSRVYNVKTSEDIIANLWA